MTPFEISLIILGSVTVVILILIAAFLIKLLVDLSNLTNNSNEVVIIVKNEIKPTLDELQKTLGSINSIAKTADKQVDLIKKVFSTLVGAGGLAACGFKNISGGFTKGLLAGLNLFRKK